jgi:hypothetical protein
MEGKILELTEVIVILVLKKMEKLS